MKIARFFQSLGEFATSSSTEAMLREFVLLFPGRCPVCAFHRYGRREGFTRELLPAPHSCLEPEPAKSPATAFGGVEPRDSEQTGLCRAVQTPCRANGKAVKPS